MPNVNAPNSSNYTGLYRDTLNSVLELYYRGTKVWQASAASLSVTGVVVASTDLQATAGHVLVPAGNMKMGVATVFGTTQPVAAVVMGGTSKGGTAPVGAIVTCGAVFASDTVVRKMIADGTASNVET